MHKKSKTIAILESLENKALSTADLAGALFLSGYAESYRTARRKMLGIMDAPKFDYEKWKKEEQGKFYSLLSHLKQDGLVERRKSDKKSFWRILPEGTDKLDEFKKQITFGRQKEAGEWTLVIFDIPEDLRKKRVWLRYQLRSMGFELLQKSVWIGKCKIPEDFIDSLKVMRVLPHIHIFKIARHGSLTGDLK